MHIGSVDFWFLDITTAERESEGGRERIPIKQKISE